MADLIFNVTPPWGGALDLGPYVRPTLAIVGILVATLVLIRLTHILVRGILRALRSHALPEGGEELTAAEIERRQDTIESLVVNVVRFFVVGIAMLMILETAFDMDIGPAIAGLGVVGIAVGLGTQNLVRDYLNGALILIENQYSIGDVVTVAGISGTVEDFTLRRTTLRDVDGTVHTVPNGQVTIASNMTRSWSRVHLEVRVVYGTDVDKATGLIDDIGRKLAGEPDWRDRFIEAPHVERVSEFGDLGYTILILGKVAAGQQWASSGEMRKRLLAEFERRGIKIPTLTVAQGKSSR